MNIKSSAVYRSTVTNSNVNIYWHINMWIQSGDDLDMSVIQNPSPCILDILYFVLSEQGRLYDGVECLVVL